MMKKIFWDDPYLTELETEILEINGSEILLAETIAFSFSGGQESDKAFINKLPVLGSRIAGDLIYYEMPENHGLQVHQKVHLSIDWNRRYCLMRLHFAAELILELVSKKYGLAKVGAHIAEHKARIDFLADVNISQYFEEILAEYNQIIDQNLPIEKGYLDEITQRRYWKIESFAQVPCGGTHVKSTAEVGRVRLKRAKPGKGVERIEIYLK